MISVTAGQVLELRRPQDERGLGIALGLRCLRGPRVDRRGGGSSARISGSARIVIWTSSNDRSTSRSGLGLFSSPHESFAGLLRLGPHQVPFAGAEAEQDQLVVFAGVELERAAVGAVGQDVAVMSSSGTGRRSRPGRSRPGC